MKHGKTTEDGRADALIEIVEEDRRDRCARIEEQSRAKVQELLRAARREARNRTRTALSDEIERNRRRIEAARAELTTKERQLEQTLASDLLERAWRELEQELLSRWREPVARDKWLQATFQHACGALPPGAWTVEHPQGLESAELDRVVGLARAAGAESVTLCARAELGDGVRVVADGATLDATSGGLLAEARGVEGRLLLELTRDLGEPRARRA